MSGAEPALEHADALERLATLAEEPERLAAVEIDPSAEGRALRSHLASCQECRAELAAWRMTAAALSTMATPDLASMRAPEGARERTLALIAQAGVPRHASPAGRPVPGSFSFRRFAMAAAAAVVIFVGGALLAGPLGLGPQGADGTGALAAVVQASDQILRQPDHRVATLQRPDGSVGGSVLADPASGEIVVISDALQGGPAQQYDCYLIRGAAEPVWIGPMRTQEGASFWAGTVTSVSSLGQPGDVLQVRPSGGGASALSGTF
jgi:hypothetical protein